MSSKRQLRLGAFMRPVSIHTAAWRYPGGTPDANFNLKALISYAQTPLEAWEIIRKFYGLPETFARD